MLNSIYNFHSYLFYFRCYIDDYFKSANNRVRSTICMRCRVLYPLWGSLCGSVYRCHSTFLYLHWLGKPFEHENRFWLSNLSMDLYHCFLFMNSWSSKLRVSKKNYLILLLLCCFFLLFYDWHEKYLYEITCIDLCYKNTRCFLKMHFFLMLFVTTVCVILSIIDFSTQQLVINMRHYSMVV